MPNEYTDIRMLFTAIKYDNSWFKQLFESSPDPTWIIEDSQFVECNESAIRTLGYASREEFLNTHPSKLSPARQPDGEESFAKAERMMAIAKDKGLHRFEWIHTKANGSDFVAEVTLSRIELQEKSIIYCVWRDITERKLAETSLRHKQAMLARTESIANIGSWEWDMAMDHMTWSDELFRIFQRDPANGAPSFEEHQQLFYPEDIQRFRDAVDIAISHGTPYEMELRAIRKDGVTRVCLARGHVEKGSYKIPTILYGSLQDVSEKRRFEAQLDASEKRYQAIFTNASEAIAIAKADGTLEEVNGRFAALLGYDEEELIGMHIERIHPADEMPRIRQRFEEIFSTGHMTPLETKIVRKDGKLVEVEIRTTHIEIGERKVAQGIFTDLSERKRKEQKRIEEETLHRNTLVREVHHRIKNNLQSVAGLLQRELGRFGELAPRLETAISQVNTIAVVHGLQSSKPNEAIRLCDSIRNICKMASELAQRTVVFCIENEQTTFRSVEIESSEAVSVALILNELVLNALKHSPDGGSVPSVSMSADGISAQLVIRNALTSKPDFDIDTGKGLGTGLGLVRSLLPEEGAQLSYELDAEDFLLTILRLTAPVVFTPKQKAPD